MEADDHGPGAGLTVTVEDVALVNDTGLSAFDRITTDPRAKWSIEVRPT